MRIRVITPVYNESELLPGFLRHYGKIAESILILDNGSTDGSAEIAKGFPRVELRKFETDGYDVQAVMDALAHAKDESHRHDWCLFPDCDELLAMRDGSSLRAHLEKVEPEYDVICTTGYDLVRHGDEDPFDSRKDWLGQRKFGVPHASYNKPIIIRPRTKARLGAGNHRLLTDNRKRPPVYSANIKVDPAVVLIHFEMIDFYLWYYRKTRRALSENNKAREWNPRFCKDAASYHQMWQTALGAARALDKEVPVLQGGLDERPY